jgi:hypothetical protein
MSKAVLLAGLTLTLVTPGLTVLAQPPRPERPVLVLLPPWADGAALISRAGGRPASPVSAPFARLAYDPAGDSPALAARLRGQGAWAVVDASVLALICGAT